MEVYEITKKIQQIRDNISKVIVGKDDVITKMLTAILASGHVLVEDMPGTGKTMLAKALAKTFGGDFSRIQFTPDLLPSDITGLSIYNQKSSTFEFVPGPVFANIVLADEVNRATPRTQSSLLECMEEKQVTVDGETRKLDLPFFIIATQNPIETAGTYPLPEAQMDRFCMQLSMGFPSFAEEIVLMDRFIEESPLETLEEVCSKEELYDMQQRCKKVFVHNCIREYIAHIVEETRTDSSLSMGVNPRGTLAYLRCCQAYALTQGRNFVTPDDVRELAVSVLAHRIILHSANSNLARETIERIVAKVPVPTEDFEK